MASKIITREDVNGLDVILVEHSNSNFGEGITHINFYVGSKNIISDDVDKKFRDLIKPSKTENTLCNLAKTTSDISSLLKHVNDEDAMNKERRRIVGEGNFLSTGHISYRGNDLDFMDNNLNYIGAGYYTKVFSYEEALRCGIIAVDILTTCVTETTRKLT